MRPSRPSLPPKFRERAKAGEPTSRPAAGRPIGKPATAATGLDPDDRAPAPRGGEATPAPDGRPPQADLDWSRWRVSPGEDRGDGWSYAACPRCQGRDGQEAFPTLMAHLPSGRFFCAKCGHHGEAGMAPSQYRAKRVDLSEPWWQAQEIGQVQQWLGALIPGDLPVPLEVGLDRALVEHEDRLEWETALVLPCRTKAEGPPATVMFLPFSAEGELLPVQDLPGTDHVPWGWDQVEGDTVVFVSHPLDRLALMMAGVKAVAAMPARMNPLLPGGGDWSALGHIEKDLATVSRVVMAMRDDEAGRALEEELARRVGKDRCMRVRWQNHRSTTQTTGAQSVLAEHGPQALAALVAEAPPFPVAGVHELQDVEESFECLYEFGLKPGVSTGMPSMDMLYTVKTGQWTVITGIPGHGKTTLLDNLLVNLAQLHGWKFGVFSPESQPIERHYASFMEKITGLPFSEGPHARIPPSLKDELKGFLNEHFKIILPDEDNDGNWTLDHILALGRTLVYRHGIKGLVIDPWNELIHMRPPHVTETEHLAVLLTKVRRFSRIYGVHVWVVVHPNRLEKGPDGNYAVVTPYMLAGGAIWRNKADNILSAYRFLLRADEDILDVYSQKIRFKEVGALGRASLRGDPLSGKLIDDIDQGRRTEALRAPTPVPTQNLRTTERRVRKEGMPIQATADGLSSRY